MSDQEDAAARMARAAEATGRFNAIRVGHGPQNALVGGLDGIRMQAIAIRAARAETGLRIPMPVIRTIAELGVGKTIGAERLVERHLPADPADQRRPAIIATLDTTGLPVSVPHAILRALGKPNPNHATKPSVAWDRAHRALREHDVQLVIFDETNRAARRPSMGQVIGGDLMDMLVDGEAAIAFLGTTEANKVFNRVPALKDRMKSPVVLKPLEWYDDVEKAIFVEFLNSIDQAMLDCGLVTEKGGLGDYVEVKTVAKGGPPSAASVDGKDTAKLLWEVCRGRLRPLCLLLEEAIALVHYYGDRLVLDHEILAQAVENHSIENGIVKHNPFKGEKPR